jgi:putative transcriptional regulator
VFALARASHKPEGATDVSGDIYFITALKALETALAEGTNPSRLRICLGYCGWGPRQLENEVSHGGWYIFSHEGDLAFDAKPATLWPRLIGRADDQTARLDFAWPAR